MTDLERCIDGATRAHRALLADVGTGTEAVLRRPSLLPGWTVAHVLGHLAANADSIVRMLDAAGRGEVADQYPGGPAGRAAEIDELAALDAPDLVARLRRSVSALEQAWAEAPAEAWQGSGRGIAGTVATTDLPFRRWRETVVHHADLGGAYTWTDWPADYVRLELAQLTMVWASRRPMGLTALPPEALAAPDAQRVAWLLGRAEIAGLGPAGVFG
jgi:maleylpyruvate isomerase